MAKGPIEKYESHHALNEKRRREAIDKATAPKKKEKKKNPYPKGSYRAKLWERREAEKKK